MSPWDMEPIPEEGGKINISSIVFVIVIIN